MSRARPIDLCDAVLMPAAPAPDALRDGFLAGLSRVSFGIVPWRRWDFHLGPLRLFVFGEPAQADGAWRWPIEGGLLVAEAGGVTGVGWRDGRLFALVEGYRPRLPRALYSLLQLPVHRLATRVYLLRTRGRTPSPGLPAAPATRLAAAGLDLVLCAGAARLAPRRRRVLAFICLTAGYHLVAWSVAGRTLGGSAFGLRVVSLDGSAPSFGQASLRLLGVPAALMGWRALHDEAAATDVVAGPTLPPHWVGRPGGAVRQGWTSPKAGSSRNVTR